MNLAIAKRVFISRSDSPIHFETKDDAEIEKNVESNWLATALPIIVLPVPGGPNKRIAHEGSLKPTKISGFLSG